MVEMVVLRAREFDMGISIACLKAFIDMSKESSLENVPFSLENDPFTSGKIVHLCLGK